MNMTGTWRAKLGGALTFATCTAGLFFSGNARAADAAPRDAARDLARASIILEQAADSGRDSRHAAFVVGLGTAAVLVPTGLALDVRGGDVPRTVGTGLLASAGGALFVSALALRPSSGEELLDSYSEWRASGMPDAQLLERTERAWSERADAAAGRRALWGTLETAGGGLFMLCGSALLLAPPVAGLSRAAQYRVGSLLLGSGVPFFSFGVHSLFQKSPVETSWIAYRGGRASAPAAATLSLGAQPIPGGLALVASAAL